MALLDAQLARVDGDLDRAAGLFGRANREARSHDLTPLVAFASEERARMLEEAGSRSTMAAAPSREPPHTTDHTGALPVQGGNGERNARLPPVEVCIASNCR